MITADQEAAADLLEAVWQSIPNGYKAAKRRTIWVQFRETIEAAIDGAANLSEFLHGFATFFDVDIGPNVESRARAMDVWAAADDEIMLRLLERETKTLVLMVRARTDARRQMYEQGQMEKHDADGE